MDRATVALYEREVARYRSARTGVGRERARALAELARGAVLDAGCGPGIYTGALGAGAVALDASRGMVRAAVAEVPSALGVQADLQHLPLRRGALGGAWARQSYLHLRRAELPAALADLHGALGVGAPVTLALLLGAGDGWKPPDDDFPGRFFAGWDAPALTDVLVGAGFGDVELETTEHKIWARGRRARTLPDLVSPDMRVLFCGLNPSLHAADAGVGYAGPGNRFWPALAAAAVWEGPRDPRALLAAGYGMTDLVKRATPRAAELARSEFSDGAARVERLVRWLRPASICFVGLTGYRAALHRAAGVGWQGHRFGDVATYVMPSTSGLNTRTGFDELVAHLRAVGRGAP